VDAARCARICTGLRTSRSGSALIRRLSLCSGAQFDDVEAQNAIFTNVRFKGSRFEDVDLTNAQFSDAHIEGARVNGVPLQDALDAYRHQQQAR
jgi:uncharacterized protein YjbI with pentapeptide repeats